MSSQPSPGKPLLKTVDPLFVPLVIWNIRTAVPEEDAALRLTSVGDYMTRDTIRGRQAVRGGVQFGRIRMAVVQREKEDGWTWLNNPDNPLVYGASLVLRGTITESDGATNLRIIAMCGFSPPVLLVASLVAAYLYSDGAIYGLPLLVALVPYAVATASFRVVLREVREHVMRAFNVG